LDAKAIPGYTIKKKLGAGAMATVFLAIEEKLHRNVALKIMSGKLLTDPSFAERFLREARIVASMSHRNMVTVFDLGTHESYHYMAMEFLPGGNLSSKIKAGLPLKEAISHVVDIAEGLHYAASKNLVHRDIKPDNIMFAEDGRAVITDFGIARNTDSETNMTMAGSIIGTPQYMSPEQAQAQRLDHRSDLYSLGIIVYEILAGRTPFKGDSAISTGVMHITQAPPPLPTKYWQFQEFVDKALAKNPGDRFQSGHEFIKELSKIDLEQFEDLQEDDVETLLMSSSDINKALNSPRVQKSSNTSLLDDLSDEFLSTTPTPIPESKTQFKPRSTLIPPSVSKSGPAKTKSSSSSFAGLTIADLEEVESRTSAVRQQKKSVSFQFPVRSAIFLLVLFTLIGAHVFFVNILGKQIPFNSFITNLENMTEKVVGTRLDFSSATRLLINGSNGFANLSEQVLVKVIPSKSPQFRLSGKEKQFVELLDEAMQAGRLYSPPFDCAELYLQELKIINPDHELILIKSNELMVLSLDTTLELINSKEFDKAAQILEGSQRLLPDIDDPKLRQRHKQVTSTLEIARWR